MSVESIVAVVAALAAVATLAVAWRQLRLSAKQSYVNELEGRLAHLEKQVGLLEGENQALTRQNLELMGRALGLKPQP